VDVTKRQAETALQGTEAVRSTLAQIESIQVAVDSSAVTISETNELSGRIGEIVVTIDEIADQTNLLALNAAIEAARAGEQGKGFAVVADEVRKLADRSRSATREIATIVDTVQASAGRAAASMDVATKKVKRGAELARDSGQALDHLLASASDTREYTDTLIASYEAVDRGMDEVSTSIGIVSLVASKNTETAAAAALNIREVTQLVDNVAAISEENAASAESVTATVQEVAAQTEEINAAAVSLNRFARELEASTAQFTVN
jgi:methyl-accepting chemotaxis protein